MATLFSQRAISLQGVLAPRNVLLALVAIVGALGIYNLPYLGTQVNMITVLAVVAGAFVILSRNPLWALIAGIVFGTSKAALGALYEGIFPDFGQLFIVIAVCLWVFQRLAARDVTFTRTTLILPLLLFTVVGMLSIFAARDVTSGIEEVVKWLQVLLIMLIVAERMLAGASFRNVVLCLMALVLAQAALGYWQAILRGDGVIFFQVSPGRYRAYGTFEQPNPYAGFLGMSWPIAFGVALGLLNAWRNSAKRLSQRHFIWICLALLTTGAALAGMFYSNSRGAWLGGVAALGVMLILLPRRRALGIVLVGLITVMLGFAWQNDFLPTAIVSRVEDAFEILQFDDIRHITITDANFSTLQRFAQWQAALDMAKSSPFIGIGIGGYDAAYAKFRLPQWEIGLGHAHNIYLNFLAEIGAVGLFAYLLMWIGIFSITLRTLNRSTGLAWGVTLGLMGVWMHLTVHHLLDNLYVNNLHIYFGALLGILAALHLNTKTTDTETA